MREWAKWTSERSEQASEVSKRASEWAKQSAKAKRPARVKRAGRSKGTNEWCEQTSEWTSKWPSTLVCYSGPQCSAGEKNIGNLAFSPTRYIMCGFFLLSDFDLCSFFFQFHDILKTFYATHKMDHYPILPDKMHLNIPIISILSLECFYHYLRTWQ